MGCPEALLSLTFGNLSSAVAPRPMLANPMEQWEPHEVSKTAVLDGARRDAAALRMTRYTGPGGRPGQVPDWEPAILTSNSTTRRVHLVSRTQAQCIITTNADPLYHTRSRLVSRLPVTANLCYADSHQSPLVTVS